MMIQPRPHTRLRDFQPVPPEIRKDVERYRQWLVNLEGRRGTTREDTSLPLVLEERHSARKTLTLAQALFLVAFLLASGIASFFLRLEMVTIALGLVTTLYLVQLSLHAFIVIRELAQDERSDTHDPRILDALRTAPWPLYTILCPLYREEQVVAQFIRAMQALDYPPERLQVILLTEEEDEGTRSAIRSLGPLPSSFELVTVPHGFPRTKPRACNYGLTRAQGKYVVIYDAEDIPEPTQVKKAVLAFAEGGPKLACTQAKLNFYNPNQNILTRLFTIEYSLWFDLVLPAFARARYALPLGGTSNHFQTGILRALGGWDAYNVTEDCDLGMRVNQYGFETGMLASTTYEEANSSLGNWIRQRSRWIKGFCQTYLVHMRHPLESITKKRGKTLRSLQTVVGASTAVFFLNPLMWLFLVVYMAFRPYVEDVYHVFFPAPVLYGGMLCLIFGNFFYLYIAMLTCAKREQYNLVPWCFLLPVYWLLMSVAGIKGLFQLVTRPHYWEKTQHGLHLGKGSQGDMVEAVRITSGHLADQDTMRMAAVPIAQIPTTMRVKAIETLPVPIVKEKETTRKKERDYWLWGTVALACTCSVVATIHFFNSHDILLYSDAYFHLRIARRVFDSATPGIGQLGTTWLPLPHLLMLPFIWNNYLWRTGLAGTFPSMLCYIASALYLFLSVRRLTKSSLISFVGTLLFILNPNILYLQSTPMSELVCIVTLTASCYYFLTWIQDGRLECLILTAGSVFLTTLARYDGWALFGALFILIPVVGLMRRQGVRKIIGNSIIFLTPGSFGIFLWLLYNDMLSGSPLYFLQGPYSSKVQTLELHNSQAPLYAYHNLWEAIHFYSVNVTSIIGPMLSLVALCAFILFVMRKHFTLELLGTLAFLTPMGFYILSLYGGQVALLVPGAVPPTTLIHNQLFNVRFGSEMVIPTSVFLATLPVGWQWLLSKRMWLVIVSSISIVAIIAQAYLITSGGIITLEDGLYGVSCEPPHSINMYLAQHYDGGRVLEQIFSYPVDGSEANFDFKNIIWEGSYQLWPMALKHPAAMVNWIITDPNNPTDQVARYINLKSPAFQSQFTLVSQEQTGLRLYHKKRSPFSLARPIPSFLVTNLQVGHQYCNTGKYPPETVW